MQRSGIHVAALIACVALCGVAGRARAWVYPEHRGIALLAVESLDAEQRATFDALWSEARVGFEERLCARGADGEQGLDPGCIDWAALSAIAGDHSCSAADLLGTAVGAPWILGVADVAAELGRDLAAIEVAPLPELSSHDGVRPVDLRRRVEDERQRARRINALRSADTRLQQSDPEYATRAGSNGAHFLLPRPSVATTAREYAVGSVGEGADINAIGVYVWYHLRALEKAGRLANEASSPAQRQALARAALVDEAFALHFLEDIFAAGHVAGSWGDAAQRKGTHDFYNEAGLEVSTWRSSSETVVLMGDAYMRPVDAELAAGTVAASLAQVLAAAAGRPLEAPVPHRSMAVPAPDDFDVCRSDHMPGPGLLRAADVTPLLVAVLEPTPVPGLGPGLGAMPRFRAELGPFLGLNAAIEGRGLTGGFLPDQSPGAMGGLDIGVRAGLGLEGVMGDAGDGLVFLQVGIRTDTPSSGSFDEGVDEGSITAAVPARTALSTRLRMPFYLVPGDLLVLAPLAFAAPATYAEMAVAAGNGGLIPWQSGLATSIGRFQLVLGREIGVGVYGLIGEDRLVRAAGDGESMLLDYESVALDLPVLEYRWYRSFARDQSSTALVQLFGTVDLPGRGTAVRAREPQPPVDLETVWSIGLRLNFDWRSYL